MACRAQRSPQRRFWNHRDENPCHEEWHGFGLILARQHDGENARGLARVGGVFRPVAAVEIVTVDFPEDGLIIDLERPKVMLTMRVVITGERIKHVYPLQDDGLRLGRERCNGGGHDHGAAGEGSSKGVIEFADASYLTVHDNLPGGTPAPNDFDAGRHRRDAAGTQRSPLRAGKEQVRH